MTPYAFTKLSVWREGVVGSVSCISGGGPTCPPRTGGSTTAQAGYYTLAGTQKVTVTPTADGLRLDATPDTAWQGDSITFTASHEKGYSFTVTRWIWQPDDGAAGQTVACDAVASPGPVCRTAVYESGTMYVQATVSLPTGQTQVEQASDHVSTGPEQLELTANPTAVKPGENVTFPSRTKNSSPYVVQGWRWVPDSGAALTDPSTCGTAKTCTLPVYESGTMWVDATIEGTPGIQSDSARVTINACPLIAGNPNETPDPFLNSLKARKTLMATQSKIPWSDPTTLKTRHERGGGAVHSNGAWDFLEIPNHIQVDSAVCYYAVGKMSKQPDDTLDLERLVHLHGIKKNEKVYGCPYLPQGYKRWKLGPSPADLKEAKDGEYTGYLLEANGDLYRWNYPAAPGSPNANVSKRWRRDGGSLCWLP